MLEALQKLHDKAIEQSERSESKFLEISEAYPWNLELIAEHRTMAAMDRHYAKGVFDAMKIVTETEGV